MEDLVIYSKKDQLFAGVMDGAFVCGLLLSFVSTQISYEKFVVIGSFIVGLAICCGVIAQSIGNRKFSQKIRLLWMQMAVVAVAMFFCEVFVFERWFAAQQQIEFVWRCVWVFLLFFSFALAVYSEVVFFSNPYFPWDGVEGGLLFNSSLRIVLLVVLLVILTVFIKSYDNSWNLSFLKKGAPSAATAKIVDQLAKPLKVGVFFEQESEVLSRLRNYFDALNTNQNIEVGFYDKYYNPYAAKKFEVAKNGYVVFEYDGKLQPLFIGETIDKGKKVLKKLDSEVARRIIELTSAQAIVYFTQGHGEANWGTTDANKRTSIRLLELILKQLNYSLRTLNIDGGLAQSVPKNADLVVIAAPDKDFLLPEVKSLQNYLRGGGSVMLLLEPRSPVGGPVESTLDGFIADLGLRYHPSVLADEQKFIRITRGAIDHWYLFTNNYGIHPAVQSLALNEQNLAVAFFEAGYLTVHPNSDWKSSSLVKTYQSSFIDKNTNYKKDSSEIDGAFDLGFALEKPTGAGKISRLVALADASVVSDELMQNTGNTRFVVDLMKWLSGREALIGAQSAPEDKPILRSGKEDKLYFQLSLFVVPLLILMMGLYVKFKRVS